MEKEYHVKCSKGDVAGYMLVVGDPGRAELIGEQLKLQLVAKNREYTTYTGVLENNIPISVASLGIGCPSTAIGLEEFARCGVSTFIRVGTSGSLQENVKVGSLVNGTAAIRDEGTSRQYIPLAYPAAAHVDVVLALRKAAIKMSVEEYHEGIIHSKDAFYIEEPSMIPDVTVQDKWKIWQRGRCLATEMESSLIYTLGSIRGWRTGTILAVIGATWDDKPIVIEAKDSVKTAIDVAVDAIRILYENDNLK
ncbi:MAG: nucleoside phosphorylase [Candidatus Hodarchaeales archaeon]|jgi:uridine phosphorylase